MTLGAGHPWVFSFGRAVVREFRDGTTFTIKPGDYMKSGWTSLLPTKKEDYDIERCTVIAESWRANSFRFDYPGGEDLIPRLEKCILGLSDSCEWYEPVQTLDKYALVPLPSSYKGRKVALKALLSSAMGLDQTVDYSTSDDLDDEEDEEVTTYDGLHEAIRAVQESNDLDLLDKPAEPGKPDEGESVIPPFTHASHIEFFSKLSGDQLMGSAIVTELKRRAAQLLGISEDQLKQPTDADEDLARRLQQQEYDENEDVGMGIDFAGASGASGT